MNGFALAADRSVSPVVVELIVRQIDSHVSRLFLGDRINKQAQALEELASIREFVGVFGMRELYGSERGSAVLAVGMKGSVEVVKYLVTGLNGFPCCFRYRWLAVELLTNRVDCIVIGIERV
jgi:hypothetical protein